MKINNEPAAEFSLMFFLAEKLLNKGYSISLPAMNGLQLIKAVSGKESCLFIAEEPAKLDYSREKVEQLCKIFPDISIVIPVFRSADLSLTEELISGLGHQNLEVCQFPLADSFIYHRRKFEERREVK